LRCCHNNTEARVRLRTDHHIRLYPELIVLRKKVSNATVHFRPRLQTI
jgi:hypothetical protein